MQIIEIFESIQGEGRYLGVPAIFIRTAGCNLACPFCDTKHSWDGTETGFAMSAIDIVNLIRKNNYHAPLVVITGGEPCLQKDLIEVIANLKRELGVIIAIETNGTLPTPPNADWITCSPKPDANYATSADCHADEYKFVVTEDFDPLVITEDLRESYGINGIWLQPDGFNLQPMWKKAYDIALADPRMRVGIQLHKLMEVR